MSHILVTIDTPTRSLDLSLPAGLAGRELIRMLGPTLGAPDIDRATLTTSEGMAIEDGVTLEAAGVLDGSRLSLRAAADPTASSPAESTIKVDPDARATRVVPDRIRDRDRLTISLKAFVGINRPSGAASSFERARAAWEWTDHRTRLHWLISRPRMDRSVTIGVMGHRSDEVAEGVGRSFSEARPDRVVVIDGDLEHARISRRLPAGTTLEEIESGLRRRDLGSVARDRLFEQLPGGVLAIPLDPSAAAPDSATLRRLLESLTRHAAIAVIDCGSIQRPNAAALEACDQVVVSTTGPSPHIPAQTTIAVWDDHMDPIPGEAYAVHQISERVAAHSELAAILASGWSLLGIATPVPLGV